MTSNLACVCFLQQISVLFAIFWKLHAKISLVSRIDLRCFKCVILYSFIQVIRQYGFIYILNFDLFLWQFLWYIPFLMFIHHFVLQKESPLGAATESAHPGKRVIYEMLFKCPCLVYTSTMTLVKISCKYWYSTKTSDSDWSMGHQTEQYQLFQVLFLVCEWELKEL